MRQSKKTIIKLLVGLSIGALFLLVWVKIIDVREVVASLKNLKLQFVLLGIIFYLAAYFVRAIRWRMLLKTVVPIGVIRAYLTVMGGHFTNYLIPLRAGELMRCLFIKKMTGVRMSQSMPSVFLDKLYDTVGVVLVLVLLPFLKINMHPYLNYLLILIVVVVLISLIPVIIVMKNKEAVVTFGERIIAPLPDSLSSRLNEILRYFIDGIALFKEHKRLILPAVLLSLIVILFDSFFFLSMFKAFVMEIRYIYVLFGYTLIYLSFIVPHPPAQIGSNELLMVLIFAVGFGMNRDAVSAVMVFAHLLTGLIIVALGLISYSYAGVNLVNIINRGDEVNE